MSALAAIFSSLGELSESELQQLYLSVGVRLGIPGVPTRPSGGGKAGGKSPNAGPSTGKPGKKSTSSKGNPQRKSQWANHPLYQEYSRLKKVVETQSKEQKCSFNSVDTAESRAYHRAFSQWLKAKSSFRGHGEGDQNGESPAEKKTSAKGRQDDEDSSEEEEDGVETAPTSQRQSPTVAPRPPQNPGTGKSSPPAGKGKAPAK
jgi:hypothetical protein